VDWDGDGSAGPFDEWIEIVNLGPEAVDLAGWALDDTADAGSSPYIFPSGVWLAPGGFLLRFRSMTGVALNQDADAVRLLAPDGVEVDRAAYERPRPDASYSRTVDGIGDWTSDYPPSPGGPNRPGPATSTPTPTATSRLTATPTSTRLTRTPTPTRTVTPAPSITPTPTPYDRSSVRLNEILPRPATVDWNGDGTADLYDEWVELHNPGATPIDLTGWALDDIADGGSAPYVFPAAALLAAAGAPAGFSQAAVLPPGGYLVIFRSTSGVAFNNDSDTVRLLGPDAALVDAFSYVNPPADRSFSRTADGAWTTSYPPSPGGPNTAPSPTPTATPTGSPTPFPSGVTLNELLPDPDAVDWDGDAATTEEDEWIELYNAGADTAHLAGWALADAARSYTLPAGALIEPQGWLVFFRRQTRLALNNDGDQVRLIRPDGGVADQFEYTKSPGPDRSYCRSSDGTGAWTRDCVVTLGQANRLLPTPTPQPTAAPAGPGSSQAGAAAAFWAGNIAGARGLAEGSTVAVSGAVTLPPGLFGRRIYMEDDSAGVRVYLRRGDYPPLMIGDQVHVTGKVDDYHGELEIVVNDPSRLILLGKGAAPAPKRIATGQVDEAIEGRLVWVFGRVAKYESAAWIIDDGSGPTRVYFPDDLPWRRPFVRIGEMWAVQGVVSQYVSQRPYVGGYRLIPRLSTDVGPPPAFLPVTGGD